MDWNYGKRGVVFPCAKKRTVLVTVAETYVKTIHAGIDGLKVDTQVLKLLRILFVEHYKHTLVHGQ